MSTPSWMLVRLALDTRHHHAEADADRLAMMEVQSITDYRDFLARIYGFEAAVEGAVEMVPALTGNKTKRLEDDLRALGITDLEKLPRCKTVKVRSATQAYAWAFVIERQALLSGLVRRHLDHTRPEWVQNAGSYLSSQSGSAGSRLRAFGDALAAHASFSAREPAAIVASASEAFRAQRQWYLNAPMHERLRALFDDPLKQKPSATPPREPEPVDPTTNRVDTQPDLAS